MTGEQTLLDAATTATEASPEVPPTVVEISAAELLGLLAAAGLTIGVPSPFAESTLEPTDPTPATRQVLVDAGWLTGGELPELTHHGRAVVSLLAAPTRRVDLVLGTASWWFTWTGLSGDERDGPVLTVTRSPDDDLVVLSYPQPPALAVEFLAEHLGIGSVRSAMPFDVELSDDAATTWLGVLDDRAAAGLEAVLDREPVTRLTFGVDDVLAALAEGRTSRHLAWQTPVTSMLWPDLDTTIDADTVRGGLHELAAAGLLDLSADGATELTDGARAVVDALVPVARWAGVVHTRRDLATGALTTERLAVRRGVGATVVEHRPLGGTTTSMRSVADTDLEMLVAALHRSVRSGEPATVPPLCPSCRTILHDDARFCHECGAQIPGDGGTP